MSMHFIPELVMAVMGEEHQPIKPIIDIYTYRHIIIYNIFRLCFFIIYLFNFHSHEFLLPVVCCNSFHIDWIGLEDKKQIYYIFKFKEKNDEREAQALRDFDTLYEELSEAIDR